MKNNHSYYLHRFPIHQALFEELYKDDVYATTMKQYLHITVKKTEVNCLITLPDVGETLIRIHVSVLLDTMQHCISRPFYKI